MDIYICIGSSCHLKGSRSVIEKMEERIRREHLEDRVNIRGSFCMGNCTDGVCVRVGEKTVTGVNAENFDEKSETEILGELRDE